VHTPDKSAPQLKEQTSHPNKGVYCVALSAQWDCNMHASFTEHGWVAVSTYEKQGLQALSCATRYTGENHITSTHLAYAHAATCSLKMMNQPPKKHHQTNVTASYCAIALHSDCFLFTLQEYYYACTMKGSRP